MLIDSAGAFRADCTPDMKTPCPAILSIFQRWQAWLLQAMALTALAACSLPAGHGGLSAAPAPYVQGIYQGSYTYGSAYHKLAGKTVPFEISLKQARGSGRIRGVVRESYTGFGTLQDGFVWADITGTCESDAGYTRLKFTKTYRRSKEPPVNYSGSLPPGSSLLSGTWYFPSKPSDSGMFQISNMHVP